MIKLTKQWDSQPQAATSAVAAFDVVAYIPGLPELNGKVISQDAGVTQLPGRFGLAASINGGTSVTRLLSNSLSLPTQQITILLAGKATTPNIYGEIGVASTSAAVRCGAHIPYTDGVVYWDFGGTTAGSTRLTCSGLSFSEGDVWAFTAGPRGMEIWQNGFKVASNAATPTRSPSASAFVLGAHATTSGASSSIWYGAFVSSRQLPERFLAEATQGHAGLFGSVLDPQRIWVPVTNITSGNYSITADSGNYSITGQTASVLKNNVLSAEYGTYTYSGQSANIFRNKVISANHGSYSYSGQTASLLRTRIITADSGSYTYSGQNATVTWTGAGTNYNLVADKGDYTYTGQSATLKRNKLINALNGTYSITGEDATISYSGSNTITLKAGSWLRYRIIQ